MRIIWIVKIRSIRIVFSSMITEKEYQTKKQQLIKELPEARRQGAVALGKSTSNLFRHREQKNVKKINVRNFNNVISIDKKNLTAEVEGMVTYENFVRETLKYGLMPTVVPELKSITVGGAVTGLGIESSSFKFGLVHETVIEMEIMLGDGRIVVAAKDNEYKDLFFGFPNSYGTLGYALKLKVKLAPTKKFVKLNHLRYNNAKDYFYDLEKIASGKKEDFIDGTIFNEKEMYITLGKFADKAPFTSDYTYWRVYYKSIRKKRKDYLTIYDYVWRWDTDWFWCSKHFFAQNIFIRLLLGRKKLNSIFYSKARKLVNKNIILRNLMKIFGRTESIIQDVEIPIENCSAFINFFHKEIGIKPVWVCPTAAYNKNTTYNLYAMDPNKLYINFGFWDTKKTDKPKGYYNRLIEKKVYELNGKKSLYSDSYYERDEFWNLYNKKDYEELKRKYDPINSLLNLYDKCVERK